VSTLLEVSDVAVTFGGLRALDNVSLSVREASVTGLIGSNGAGKTTLFNVISGLQPASNGRIALGGRDISALPPNQRAALGVGRSFQNLGLMVDDTIRTNLLAAQHLSAGYGLGDLALRPWRWISGERRLARQVAEVAAAFGLTDVLDEVVADLSFARARFAELACVLVQRPTLMLLDEPTTGLDGVEIEQLLTILHCQRDEGTTILLVAHDVRFVMQLCDQVYVLAEGRNLFDGRPEEVQRHPAVVEAYLGRSV
jgi:ABC-type branched-subunit amino acid transport system ATPase component